MCLRCLTCITQDPSIYTSFQVYMHSNSKHISASSGPARALNFSTTNNTTTTTNYTTNSNSTTNNKYITKKSMTINISTVFENHTQVLIDNIHTPINLILPILERICMLLHDKPPIPQYIIRLLYDILHIHDGQVASGAVTSGNSTNSSGNSVSYCSSICVSIVKEMGKQGIINELILLLRPIPATYTPTHAIDTTTTTTSNSNNNITSNTMRVSSDFDSSSISRDPLLSSLIQTIYTILISIHEQTHTTTNTTTNNSTLFAVEYGDATSEAINPLNLLEQLPESIADLLQHTISHISIHIPSTPPPPTATITTPSNGGGTHGKGDGSDVVGGSEPINRIDLEILLSIINLLYTILTYSLKCITKYQYNIQNTVRNVKDRNTLVTYIDYILKRLHPFISLPNIILPLLYILCIHTTHTTDMHTNIHSITSSNSSSSSDSDSSSMNRLIECLSRCISLLFDIYPEQVSLYLITTNHARFIGHVTGEGGGELLMKTPVGCLACILENNKVFVSMCILCML